MPVCVTCTAPVPYLYTVYKTRSNIRLSTCNNCQNFADPLIEHPPIIHLLDLVLLKPRAFLHLLYNRGHQPFYADAASTDPSATDKTDTAFHRQSSFGLDTARRADLLRVGAAAIVAETVIRLCQLSDGHAVSATTSSAPRLTAAVAMLLLVVLESAAQLVISSAFALFILYYRTWWPNPSTATVRDGRQAHFRPIVVPLTLLYTSIIPLLLHATLQIWTTPPSIAPSAVEHALPMTDLLAHHMAASHLRYLSSLYHEAAHVWFSSDKIWTGTRLLAGMSAGFGLRVVLPLKPWEVSAVVLAGWAAGAGVSAFVADAVGQVRLG